MRLIDVAVLEIAGHLASLAHFHAPLTDVQSVNVVMLLYRLAVQTVLRRLRARGFNHRSVVMIRITLPLAVSPRLLELQYLLRNMLTDIRWTPMCRACRYWTAAPTTFSAFRSST